MGKVPFKDIEESILQYAAMGLKVMFTELDIEVLPRSFQGADVNQRVASNPALNPYPNGLPDSVQQQLATDYENLFKLFLKHKDKVTRITFWGVNDGQSWLNDWPVRAGPIIRCCLIASSIPNQLFTALSEQKNKQYHSFKQAI